MIFNRRFFSGWVFGSIFLKKYQLIFNEDLKTIGYYKSFNNYYENNDIISNNNKFFYLVILLIFIFAFIFIYFGMIIQKKYFSKNRKIRANELEENFSYESNFNNDKDIDKKEIIITEEKKQIKEPKYFSI